MPLLTSLVLLVPQMLPPATYERLDNGLNTIVFEDRALPLVSVQLWFRVGSAYDSVASPGLAHLSRLIVEQRCDVKARLRIHGRCESRTLRDGCYLACTTPRDRLAATLNVLADAFKNEPPTRAEIENAVRIAANEHRSRDSIAARNEALEDTLLTAAFPAHPYQHRPGTVAARWIDAPIDEFSAFLSSWFVPGNATLLVIGDVETVATREAIRKAFAGVAWAEPPRRAPLPRIERPESGDATVIERGAPAQVQVGWVTNGWGYFENAAIRVLMHRLCNEVDGPLRRRLTEAGFAAPQWSYDVWREEGWLTITLTGAPQNPAALWETAREEIARAADAPASEIELHRARALAQREMRDAFSGLHNRSIRLATNEIVGGDLLLALLEQPQIDRTGIRDLQNAAAALLEKRCVVSLPDPRATSRPASFPAGSAADKAEAAPIPVLSPAKWRFYLRNSTIPAPRLKWPPAKQFALDKGRAAFICATTCDEPAVVISVRTNYDSRDYDAWFPWALSDDAGGLPSAQIRDYVSYQGLRFETEIRDPRMPLVGVGPADFVAALLELQGLVLLASQEAKLNRLPTGAGNAWLIGLEGERFTPEQFAAQRAWNTSLTACRMSEANSLETPAPSVTRVMNTRTVVVGNIDGEATTAQIEAALARLLNPSSGGESKRDEPGSPATPAYAISRNHPGPTVRVYVVFAPASLHDSTPSGLTPAVGWTLAALLGAPSECIMRQDGEIRAPWVVRPTISNALVASATLPRIDTDAAIDLLLADIRAILGGAIDPRDFESAKQFASVVYAASLDGNRAIAQALTHHDDPFGAITNAEADNLQTAIQTWMRNARVWVSSDPP